MSVSSPALSVCLFTNSPPTQIRAVLAPLAALKPEVIVAVDGRMPAPEIEVFTGFVDRLFVAPYAAPPERGFPWLHTRCSGNWILRLDGDEVPSAGMAAELSPIVTGQEPLTHAIFRRRWLYPDGKSYLVDWPWTPDRQPRLIRNDPALFRIPGTMHSSVEVAGAGRYAESTIYHADLLMTSQRARADKAAAYDAERSDVVVAGRSFNEAYYLPETRAALRTAPVPEEDRRAIEALLDCGLASAAGGARCRPERVTREEIDAAWPGRPLAEADYLAAVEILEEGVRVYAGERRTVDLRVRNLGTWTWPWGASSTPEVRVAQRWHFPDGRIVEGARTLLPEPLAPGGSCRLAAELSPPPTPHPQRVEFDLIHENVRWFGAGVTIDVEGPIDG